MLTNMAARKATLNSPWPRANLSLVAAAGINFFDPLAIAYSFSIFSATFSIPGRRKEEKLGKLVVIGRTYDDDDPIIPQEI
jgi:hypothetical protein